MHGSLQLRFRPTAASRTNGSSQGPRPRDHCQSRLAAPRKGSLLARFLDGPVQIAARPFCQVPDAVSQNKHWRNCRRRSKDSQQRVVLPEWVSERGRVRRRRRRPGADFPRKTDVGRSLRRNRRSSLCLLGGARARLWQSRCRATRRSASKVFSSRHLASPLLWRRQELEPKLRHVPRDSSSSHQNGGLSSESRSHHPAGNRDGGGGRKRSFELLQLKFFVFFRFELLLSPNKNNFQNLFLLPLIEKGG